MAASSEAPIRLVRNVSLLAVAAAMTKLLTLMSGVIVARVLGPAKYGELLTATNVLLVAMTVADVGVTVLGIRKIVSGGRDSVAVLATTTTILQLVAATVMGVALSVFALTAPLPKGSGRLLLLSLPALAAMALNLVFVLQAREDMARVAVARILTTGTSSVGSVILVLWRADPTGPTLMAWIGPLVVDVLVYLWVRKRYGVRPTSVPLRDCYMLLREALPFLQNGVLYILILSVDTISLALFGTAHEVGIYNGAWTLSFGAAALIALVNDATYPEMVRRFAVSAERLRRFSERLISLSLRVVLAGTALVVVDAGVVVRSLLGASYQGSIPVLRVLFWIAPIGGLAMLMSFISLAAEKQRPLARVRLVTAGVSVLSCPVAAAVGSATTVAWVMVGANLMEIVLVGGVLRAAAVLPGGRTWIAQVDFFLVPAATLICLNQVHAGGNAAVDLGVWLLVLIGLDGVRGFSTARLAKALLPGTRG